MPKPRDGRRPPKFRLEGTAAQGQTPLTLAADHCIAAYEAVQDLNDPQLCRRSKMLLLAVGRRLAREDRHALRQLMN